MKKPIARSLLVSLTLVVLASTPVAAEKPVLRIAGGRPGGTYSAVYARNLAALLRDYSSILPQSSGSLQNLELLASGEADIAFAQADVYAASLARDPERFSRIQVLGRIADECIFVAYRKKGDVIAWGQLTGLINGRQPKVAIGREGSGMRGSWEHLKSIEPGLSNVAVDPAGDTLAINQLAIGKFDAVAWVTDPENLDHKMTRATMNNKALSFMELTDPKLVSKMKDGTEIYSPISIPLSDAWRARAINTVCTKALLMVRPDAPPQLVNLLSDYLSLYRERIVAVPRP
jgi:TRAP-type uncharacterized transport system substrate-binding protein